jgi:DNA polymerase bacteriophage-type
MPALFRDYETSSRIDLAETGAGRYAADPSTDVLCAAYALDDGEIAIWVPGQPVPEAVIAAASDPSCLFVAHNDMFESAIETHVLGPRFGWPQIPLERHRCTMGTARASALPGSLDGAAAALDLGLAKDRQGKALVRRLAKKKPDGVPTPAELEQLAAYCRVDVQIERELYRRLPPLTDTELALWVVDQTINRRGFPVDRSLALAAYNIVRRRGERIDRDIAELTHGEVTKVTQVAAILRYLERRGIRASTLDKAVIDRLLAADLDADVRHLLELRAEGAKVSCRKFGTLLAGLDDDCRLRGTLQFHGSATGRWAGSRFQPHNLPKPAKGMDIDAAVAAILSGNVEQVATIGPPLTVASAVSRSMISADAGRALIGADFSAIEGRVLAWVAGESWKVDLYRRFDETGDPALEPYRATASKILKRTVTPQDESARGIGKVAELACGFGGSVRAWRKFAPQDSRSDAEIQADISAWRSAHPKIARFWKDLELAMKRAVRHPGRRFPCGRISACLEDTTLWVTMPSGRRLAYPRARLVDGRDEGTSQIAFHDNAMGRWREKREWHGTFTENVVQAIARDLLAAAIVRLEGAGFAVVLHVHDEIVCEVTADGAQARASELAALMTQVPDWAEGLPLAAKEWTGKRYAKSAKPASHETGDAPGDEAPTADTSSEAAGDTASDAVGDDGSGENEGEEMPRWDDEGGDDYPHGEEPGRREAVYIYRDAAGRPYLKVEKHCRGDKKSFPQYHWTGTAWQSGAPKGPKIPYRLPELIAAAPAELIHLCEGEKDADTLATLGVVSTTNPEGARKGAWTAQLNPWFIGRKVIILEDNDETGRAFAVARATALSTVTADIRIVSFPDTPEHGDVTDWLALGHTKADYLARCAATAPWAPAELESVRADNVLMSAVTWLWPGRFALGKFGLIAGLPDEGKGQLVNYIVARVTTGGTWPCREGTAPLGNAIILTAEDDLADTVVPRLAAAGADLSRIHFVKMVRQDGRKRMFSLHSDLELLRAKVVEAKDVRLAAIDPVSAYMGGVGKVDSYRQTDVRAVLGPLTDMAGELGIAVLGVMHFNKKVDITNALLRISDSLAYGAAARHVYGVVSDPDNARKLVVRAKNNLAHDGAAGTLAFAFRERNVGTDPESDIPIVAPFIEFEAAYVDVSTVEAMHAASEAKSPGEAERAREFLLALLADGKPMLRKEIDDAAKAEDISQITLRRARKRLKRIIAMKTADGPWAWQLQPANGGGSPPPGNGHVAEGDHPPKGEKGDHLDHL